MAVYTQPDRPAGRGLKLMPSAVKQCALQHHLPVYQPVSLKSAAEQDVLASFHADAMIVAAYGLLLPAAVLAIPKYGCINIHPSLLPRWRGAAPIPHTILAGDAVTGVTIMQMDQGLDTGPMLYQQEYVLQGGETAQHLHDSLAVLGAEALLTTLALLPQNQLYPQRQNEALSTYAHKLSKEEATLDWRLSAVELERRVRAFNPWPVAHTTWNQQNLRIWQARAVDIRIKEAIPGMIMGASDKGIDVATGKGILRLQQLQLPGSKVLPVADFFNAQRNTLAIGHVLV
jgi:methionyl-tRNA formyltransferase